VHLVGQPKAWGCFRTGILDRHFRTDALSEVGDLACRCLANLYEDLHARDYRRRLHKHLTAAVVEIEFLLFCAL
jgi:hypothetical protein